MNTRTFLAIVAIGLVSFLTGCATVQRPFVAGINSPSTFKGLDYYKTNIKDVIAKAEAGDAASQFEAAWVLDDVKKSNFWMEKAVEQNHLSATSMSCNRHYSYVKFNYPKNDALAEKLCYQTYDIYQSKPASEWNVYDDLMTSVALMLIAEHNLSNKDKAQDALCKIQKIGTYSGDTPYVLNYYLKKIGRTCQ